MSAGWSSRCLKSKSQPSRFQLLTTAAGWRTVITTSP